LLANVIVSVVTVTAGGGEASVPLDPPELDPPELDPPELDPPELDPPELDPLLDVVASSAGAASGPPLLDDAPPCDRSLTVLVQAKTATRRAVEARTCGAMARIVIQRGAKRGERQCMSGARLITSRRSHTRTPPKETAWTYRSFIQA
jgi:hypothetical protein